MRTARMVLIHLAGGEVVAVGPVAKDDTADYIRDQAERRGHTPYGEARKISMADFNELMVLGEDGAS